MADFEFKCPSCGRSLEIDEDHRGKKTTCPSCKKSIVIPDKGPTSDAPRPRISATAQGVSGSTPDPAQTSDLVPGEEKDVFKVRPAWRAFFGRLVLAILFPVAGLILALSVSASPTLKWVIGLVGLGIGLILFIIVLVKRYSLEYRLSTQRLFVSRGLIARRIEELELYRVRDIDVIQNFWERILGCGRMMIYSTDATTPRFEIVGLAQPIKFKDIIRYQFRSARIREKIRPTEIISSFEQDTDIGQHDPNL